MEHGQKAILTGMAEGKDGQFNSFRDLMKARGGDDVPPAESEEKKAKDKGWTLEDEYGDQVEVDDKALAELPDPDFGARARIGDRPRADRPMEEGAACYGDEDSDELELLRSFRVRTVFPKDVKDFCGALSSDPTEEDKQGRLDLRSEQIYTIDGADARDYDDAISYAELEDGRVKIGVHIADVGHYVQEGTVLDNEALARGTSVYLPDQVVPMLPEAISNGLCSLVGGRDRLAYSVFMVFDAKGERESYSMAKSVICSVRRCTYTEVQDLLDGKPVEDSLEALRSSIEGFAAWTRIQQQLRDSKGSLRIDSREKKFLFDDKGEVERIVDVKKIFANTLIEETALAANQAVGDFFFERGLPTIYRVHPEKDPEEIEAVAKMLLDHGIRVPEKEHLTGRDVGRLIRQARRRPNAEALIGRIMGLVERAVYEVKDHEDIAKHFGLARKSYLHFTSPIRRYPDLIVHRWLHAVQAGSEEVRDELKADEMVADLKVTAGHASAQSEMAEMAETGIKDLKVCQFMEPHMDKKLDAKVVRVSRGGLEIHLTEFNVGGFMPARSLGGRIQLKGSTLTVMAGKRSLSFTEGYAISVRIKDVDFIRLQIVLELA